MYPVNLKSWVGGLVGLGMVWTVMATPAAEVTAISTNAAASLPVPTPTPEPATIVIGLSGFGAFMMLNRYFRR